MWAILTPYVLILALQHIKLIFRPIYVNVDIFRGNMSIQYFCPRGLADLVKKDFTNAILVFSYDDFAPCSRLKEAIVGYADDGNVDMDFYIVEFDGSKLSQEMRVAAGVTTFPTLQLFIDGSNVGTMKGFPALHRNKIQHLKQWVERKRKKHKEDRYAESNC